MSKVLYLSEADEPFSKEQLMKEFGRSDLAKPVWADKYKELIKAIRVEHDKGEFAILKIRFREYSFFVYICDYEMAPNMFTLLTYSSTDPEMGITVYGDFFELSWKAQWFLLAHEIGHHVTSDISLGGFANSMRLAKPTINGHISKYEIEADKYAYHILKSECIPAMEEILQYMNFTAKDPAGARELAQRIVQLRKDHTRYTHINGVPEQQNDWLKYQSTLSHRARLKGVDELDRLDKERKEALAAVTQNN